MACASFAREGPINNRPAGCQPAPQQREHAAADRPHPGVFSLCTIVQNRAFLCTWSQSREICHPKPTVRIGGKIILILLWLPILAEVLLDVTWVGEAVEGFSGVGNCQRAMRFPAEHLAASGESLSGGWIFSVRHQDSTRVSCGRGGPAVLGFCSQRVRAGRA